MEEVVEKESGLNSDLLSVQIPKLSSWVSFMAIMTIIGGAISCIGIITSAIGVPVIIAGLKLLKSVDNMKNYELNSNPANIAEAFTNLNKYFKILGIIMIVVLALDIILVPLSIISMMSTMSQYF